jgi:hypothetical protein
MKPGEHILVGDLVQTRFFGDPLYGVILGILSNKYGIVSLHVFISNGREVYFIPEDVELV